MEEKMPALNRRIAINAFPPLVLLVIGLTWAYTTSWLWMSLLPILGCLALYALAINMNLARLDKHVYGLWGALALLGLVYGVLLAGASPHARWQTLYAYRLMGKERALLQLAQGLRHPDSQVCRVVTEALNRVDSRWPEIVVPHYISALQHKTGRVRQTTAISLGNMGSAACAAVPALIATLGDRDSKVRKAVKDALDKVDAAWHSQAIPVFLHDLQDPESELHPRAIAALQQMGRKASPVIPALLSLLHYPNTEVRHAVRSLLNDIDAAWKESDQTRQVMPIFVAALQNAASDAREGAAWALQQLGPLAAPATSELIRTLQDRNVWVRQTAADALGAIGPLANPAVAALASTLQDRDSHVREAAAKALGLLGSASVPAIPALIGNLTDPDWRVWWAASQSLSSIDPTWNRCESAQKMRDACCKDLQKPTAEARQIAARALGSIGNQAHEAIPLLLPGLLDSVAQVRETVAMALEKIDPDWHLTEATQKWLLHGITRGKESTPENRQIAIEALGITGSAATASAPELMQALHDPSAVIRRSAIWALGRISPPDAALVPSLLVFLRDRDANTRRLAAEALGQLRSLTIAAVSELEQVALRDHNHVVREAARQSLKKIRRK